MRNMNRQLLRQSWFFYISLFTLFLLGVRKEIPVALNFNWIFRSYQLSGQLTDRIRALEALNKPNDPSIQFDLTRDYLELGDQGNAYRSYLSGCRIDNQGLPCDHKNFKKFIKQKL